MNLEFQANVPRYLELSEKPEYGTVGMVVIGVLIARVGREDSFYKPVFNYDEAVFWIDHYSEGGFQAYFVPSPYPKETLLPFVAPEVEPWPEQEEPDLWYKREINAYTT